MTSDGISIMVPTRALLIFDALWTRILNVHREMVVITEQCGLKRHSADSTELECLASNSVPFGKKTSKPLCPG